MERINKEKTRLGIVTKKSSTVNPSTTKPAAMASKLMMAPVLNIDEEGYTRIWTDLCDKCKENCE